jgi:hypothetical protein
MKLLWMPEPVVQPGTPAFLSDPLKLRTQFEDVKLKSFDRLADKVLATDTGKEDLIVPLSDLTLDGMNTIKVKSQGSFIISELAFQQLCARLKIPADYMMRCPVELRNANLAYWVEQNDDRKVMLRTRSWESPEESTRGLLRAVLPHTYEPIDNLRMLEWTHEILKKYEGSLGIQEAKVGEESTHIRLLFDDRVEMDEEQSNAHYFGVHLSGSEVGERSFVLDAVDFRVNGHSGCLYKVEGGHLLSQRHIHIDFKMLRREFVEAFAVAKENEDTIVEALRTAQLATVRDPRSRIRQLVRHYRQTNEFAETVIVAYDSDPIPTKYGIVQALTRAARRMHIDDRVDTELLAGQIILEGA